MLAQLLLKIVEIENRCELTGHDHHRLLGVPPTMYKEILDMKAKMRYLYKITVVEFQPHDGNPRNYEIQLSWQKDTVDLPAIKQYISTVYQTQSPLRTQSPSQTQTQYRSKV